ncbi:MAG: hypothetical protein HY611_07400 [Elusimicrobia bacterium]|nr:hypothetical protein [Elusimicrobiota bacterium]
MKRLFFSLFLALLLLPGGFCGAAAEELLLAVSTAPLKIGDIYKADKMRDPFAPLVGAGEGAAGTGAVGISAAPTPTPEAAAEGFNIHNLILKGILQGSGGKYALFLDPNLGVSYMLKSSKLYDWKSNPVKGILGKIEGKTVLLMTPDKDIQWFKLGPDTKEDAS